MIEWQKKINRTLIYLQFGVETGILFYTRSKMKYVNENGNRKIDPLAFLPSRMIQCHHAFDVFLI